MPDNNQQQKPFVGRGPTHKVVIPQSWKDKNGKDHTKWYEIGSAWQNEKGMSLSIITMPGVKVMIFPVTSQEANSVTNRDIRDRSN